MRKRIHAVQKFSTPTLTFLNATLTDTSWELLGIYLDLYRAVYSLAYSSAGRCYFYLVVTFFAIDHFSH